MNDQYQKLAKFYDHFVQKDRNYSEIATELAQIIGEARDLLDIGIGTGLIVENLLQIEHDYKITGIDTSESLLEEAQKRLGQKVDLYCQSVSELDIGKKFDVAYSRGGAWTFFNCESETMLASHIFSSVDIQKSFYCVAKHLQAGGLLIISYSNGYRDNLVELDNGIVHKRIATTELIENERYAILDHLFYQNEELLTQQTLKLKLLSYQTCKMMLEKAGFIEKDINPGKYYTYLKTT
ncbi:MAG: class I SAM-dependent methyltransferase [Okeania sp. SIO2C2]|uniref:class I SAM-dependent DNA methyltransferase n=1 Tax=Okeania sp. SIO2C2 TaxID=2607787 RepID=UPI0013BAC34D|nr:class I SAM-dependent methyltransferase [Okeania sp. SIO2C2]NEP91276.1 class I SAM-dependent methyltransferase [Okeania sp. SIO2C2]